MNDDEYAAARERGRKLQARVDAAMKAERLEAENERLKAEAATMRGLLERWIQGYGKGTRGMYVLEHELPEKLREETYNFLTWGIPKPKQ
jgi:hypothetical protein